MKKIRVLLLTNRDSDNVGDQIIEASVISLLKTVARNLNINEGNFEISSCAAGIISKRYLKTGDENLLKSARKAISSSDLLVFGGAPLFNYKYQSFYRRTIRTVELANEYGVPTVFSSIGVEPYAADDPRSQALKTALTSPVVRQITTRDDLASVEKYTSGTQISTALVADPAVYADRIFEEVPKARRGKRGDAAQTVGLVVTRAGIFADNDIEFSEGDQRKFWLDVIDLLEKQGRRYRLFTTGHFTDEIFLDSLVRRNGVPAKNVAFAVNSPDELIQELRACDAVIAYRLHASITAFALGIPAVGLSWNFKVLEFYKAIGYGERAISSENWNSEYVVSVLDSAVEGGVKKDDEYLYTVYRTLFEGVKEILEPNHLGCAYSLEQVFESLPRYSGTSEAEYRKKVQRKLRRSYELYADKLFAPATSPSKISLSGRVRRRLKNVIRKMYR